MTPLAAQAATVTSQIADFKSSGVRIRSGLTGESPDWMQTNVGSQWPDSQPHYRLASAVNGAVSYTANTIK